MRAIRESPLQKDIKVSLAPSLRVTPHKMGRCRNATEGTAAVSGWRACETEGVLPSLPQGRWHAVCVTGGYTL